MPHATSMPSPGLQALILCGPGASLSTFTARPEDLPKAIIPIANRPMIWYALDYCYRMGITDIYIITPPVSQRAISDTMNTNPHLTALPTPRPDIIAPKNLTHESGTANVLRQPEVRKAITGDFIVLPCDIVCEVAGESLLEAWMVQQDDLEITSADLSTTSSSRRRSRKGGLGVWYPTKGEQAFKGEETDFLVTSPLPKPLIHPNGQSVRGRLEHLMYAMPSDTMNDIVEAQPGQDKHLPLRPGLLRKAGRVKMRTSYRDAHVYIFPRWVLDMVENTPEMDSMSEDVVGSWAKATWQPGFADKLGLKEIFEGSDDHAGDRSPSRDNQGSQEHNIDVVSMSSTHVTDLRSVINATAPTSPITPATPSMPAKRPAPHPPRPKLAVPAFLGYIHPQTVEGTPTASPLVRRVDTAPMLLSVSLRLAKLDSIEDATATRSTASPLAHAAKIANPAGVAQRSTVTKADCLLDANVQVEERCVIKESVIGANCVVRAGARLTRCLLMDGVEVGEKCQLTDCVIGRRARIGKDSALKECRVQDGNAVPEGTDAKGEDIMVFEGLEEEADFGEADDGDGEGIELG